MGDYYSCPRISNEFMDCSLPLTVDTTSLCAFKCQYCFAAYQKMNNPTLMGNPLYIKPLNYKNFEDLMLGKKPNNPYYKKFISKKFPLHFGGLSDAFDWYEKDKKVTLKVLKLLTELKYPTIFSTKGILMGEGEWYEVLKQSAPNKNFIFQFSIITNNQEKSNLLEQGTPTINERFSAMKKMSDLGYWTILRLRLKSGGELNEKYPGGIEAQAAHLREEGHVVEQGRGKKVRVKDFERALVEV